MKNRFLSAGWAKKSPSGGRESFFFFFFNFFFYKIECSGGEEVKNIFLFENRKKKFQWALFRPPGRWTGNTFLFEDGLTDLSGLEICNSNGDPGHAVWIYICLPLLEEARFYITLLELKYRFCEVLMHVQNETDNAPVIPIQGRTHLRC